MELVSLKLEVPQSVYRLQKAMLAFTLKLAILKDDGWIVGQDHPLVLAALADLYAELGNVDDLKELLLKDKMAALSGLAAGMLDA